MSERSPEYKSLHHCTSGLVHLLQHNLSLSGKLLEKGLVTEDNHGWILTAHGVSDGQKAEKLVSCITDSVRESADKFDILIEILTENKSYFGHIVKRLLDERGKYIGVNPSSILCLDYNVQCCFLNFRKMYCLAIKSNKWSYS